MAMISLSPIQIAVLVAFAIAASIATILSIINTVQANIPDPLVRLDNVNDVTGRLPIYQVQPDTTLPGCAISNGTHYYTGDCLGSIGAINLTNVSLFSGQLPVYHGGTGGRNFSAGFVKAAGGNASFYTDPLIDLSTDVTDVLAANHGGLGNDTLPPGFLKSPGAGQTIVSVITINLATEVSNTLSASHGGTGGNTFSNGFLRTSGGAAAFTTSLQIDASSEVTGILGPSHGGLGHATFTQGYLFATGLGDFTSTLPIPSGHVASVLTDKTLSGATLLPDATSDALLYVSSGGFLSGLRYAFTGTDFILSPTGTNPITITVSLNTTNHVTDVSHGGTGLTSLTTGSILYASGTTTLVQLSPTGTGNVLLSGTSPTWGPVGLTTHVTGVLPVGSGGTGLTGYTIGDILYASGTSTLSKLSDIATGNVLLSGGVGVAPSYGKVDLTVHVTGILPPSSGGTGLSTYVIGDLLYASSTSALSRLPDVATGNVLLSGGIGANPAWGKVGLGTHTSGTLDLTTQVSNTLPTGNGGTGLTGFVTGDLLYATGTNTLAGFGDVATGNVLLSGGVGGVPVYGKVGLTTHVTGVLSVANGGTNIGSYTVGAILYASTSGILSQLADVATGNVLLSGGVTTAPSYGKVDLTLHITAILAAPNGGTGQSTYTIGDMLYASTTSTLSKVATAATGNVLHSNGAASPTWGQVVLTTDVSGLLPSTNGGTGFGTGNAYAIGDILYASATTTLSKLADIATGNALISGGVGVAPSYGKIGLTTHITGTLAVANGGTGFSVYAVGDILYADTTSTLAKLSDIATGNALISGGVGVASSYGKIGLTTHVSGTLPVANGGTGFIVYAVGDLLYADTTSTLAKLADIATGNVLLSGGVTTAPTYGKVGLTTHVSGILPVANGGTSFSTYAVGDILYADTTSTLAKLSDVATGNVLISGGVTTAPSYGKVGLTTHVSGTLGAGNGGTGLATYAVGDILYASGSTTLSKLADVATGNVLLSGGVTTAPSYGKVDLTAHVTSTLPTANGGTGQTTYTDGQLLIGITSGNTLTKATLTAGTGITITNGGGTITIATTSTGFTATEYTTAQTATYNIPSGAKYLRVIMCGAGGGAGAGDNAGTGGGGGGGAGICRFEDIPVDADTTATVVTGAAGVGATTVTGSGGAGAATSITLSARVVTAQSGGGGAGSASGVGGAGGGSAGSQVGGSTTTNSASGTAGGSTASGFLAVSIAGQLGGSAGAGAGNAGVGPALGTRNALHHVGGGGGGGSIGATNGGIGGISAANYIGGTGGSGVSAHGCGGGGGASGLAAGGNGCSGAAPADGIPGTKGSGGGGGCGGATTTWTKGGNGGPGYMYIQPV